MNNPTLPFLSAMALGVIIGVTGNHFYHVTELVKNGASLETPASIMVPALEEPADNRFDEPRLAQASSPMPSGNDLEMLSGAPLSVGQTPREGALLKILADQTEMLSAMRKEQKQLNKQLSETNRDMDELTFRVDAQSSDFRPLRGGEQQFKAVPDYAPRIQGGNSDLLPPKQ